VGLRTWLVDLLSRGEMREPDPDEIVEVDNVPLSEGPLTIAALREAGVDATMVEAFHAPTASTTRARIMVRRRDADAALAALAERP
jgi:hypothetical protein